MMRTRRSLYLLAFALVFLAGLFYLIVQTPGATGQAITATITQRDFVVDNEGGTTGGMYEVTLTIKNSADSEKTVEIRATGPQGEKTRGTKDVYPHIFTTDRRQPRDDVGMFFRTTIDANSELRLYPRIDVNTSAFADLYHFEFRIDNKNDNQLVKLDCSVDVKPFNDIAVRLPRDQSNKITMNAGRMTIITVELTNNGNIYMCEVGLEIDGLPPDITLIDIEYPGFDYIHPQDSSFSDESVILLGVKLSADRDSEDDKYQITITVITPKNTPPPKGHRSLGVEITVNSRKTVDDPVIEDPEEGDFPVAIFAVGLIGIIGAMGAVFYFMVLSKGGEEEGWGDGADYGGGEEWGADDWGAEPSFDTASPAAGRMTPVTKPRPSQAGAPRTAATAAGPKRGSAPAGGPRAGPASGAATKPAGPALVKCPKCATSVRVSNPKRPLTIGCPKCATKFTLKGVPGAPAAAGAPAGPPRAAPAAGPATKPAGPATVKCPKCATGIKVTNPKRPLTIGCPKCATKFTLKGAPGGPAAAGAPAGPPRAAPAAGPATKPAGPATVKCPKCATGIKVTNPKRPLTIGCPKCTAKFTLKGAPGGPAGTGVPAGAPRAGSPAAAPAARGAAPKAPAVISCPKCSTKFKVSNPSRPLKVACPKCKTGLNLK